MTQKAFFPFPVFYDFVKKRENVARRKTWDFLRDNRIAFTEKIDNPPNAPQIRPIENYWGILKMKVYKENWKAKTRDHLIRRIKMKQKEIDQGLSLKCSCRKLKWTTKPFQVLKN